MNGLNRIIIGIVVMMGMLSACSKDEDTGKEKMGKAIVSVEPVKIEEPPRLNPSGPPAPPAALPTQTFITPLPGSLLPQGPTTQPPKTNPSRPPVKPPEPLSLN